MGTYAKILGLQKLQKKLRRLPQIAKETIKTALEQSANEIVSMAKGLVPIDKGDLKNSIGWTWGRPPKGAITLGKVAASQIATELTITIYAGDSDAYYARWVEFGTQKMGAQPYFYPSYRANKKQSRRQIARAINQAAKKVSAQ